MNSLQELEKWSELQGMVKDIVIDVIMKYELYELYNDLYQKSYSIFKRCLKKYDGSKKAKFSTYFYKCLMYGLNKRAKKELNYRRKNISIDEIEQRKGDGAVEARMQGFLTIKKDFFLNSLNPIERKAFTLKAEKLTLCEISEELDLPFKNIQKIWENIKVKIGKFYGKEIKTRKEYQKEYQRKWRKENPDYHKNWRIKNQTYFKNYRQKNREKIKEYKKRYMREYMRKKRQKVYVR